ncbi:MAG: hypothetical protein FH749_00540 [Firmicutes bacterium]|nr:hypothetical protein [Bacillota bacterium]
MNKTSIVKDWVRKTGAANVVGSQDKAFGMGWKLLNAYLYFLETGCYIDDDKELYDYTCFIHEFADRFAGSDDELYRWLSRQGCTIMEKDVYAEKDSGQPNSHCPLCGKRLNRVTVARNKDGSIKKSVAGRAWCANCASVASKKKWKTS